MLIFISILWMLALLYGVLILVYRVGWQRRSRLELPADFVPEIFFSVIVPARNEEQNIAACLQSILDNDYPPELIEILVMDDHSTDRTAEIAGSFDRVRCLSLARFLGDRSVHAYKKKALEVAISQARGTVILTTDADCMVPPNWLKHIAAAYKQTHAVMVAGPVAYINDGSLISRFQSLDFMTMQGITAAAAALHLGYMSNGANLSFRKEAFDAVGGYKGIDHLASGDDYLLTMKLQQRFPGRFSFLSHQEAIVQTLPQPDWKSFLNQRIRWASKTGKYKDHRLTGILLLVYLFNLGLLLLTILALIRPSLWPHWLGLFFFKFFVELVLLLPIAKFFGRRRELTAFLFLQPLHIGYIVLAGWLGFRGSYEWKGRRLT